MQFPFDEPEDETQPGWHRYALICAAGLLCLLLLYWTARLVFWRTAAHDVEPQLENTPLTEDEQRYVREARLLRDQTIGTLTNQLKWDKETEKGSVLPPPSHEEQEKKQEKIQHMAERLVQHRDVCRPEFWAGQPLFVGFIAHLSGEYRIEQIIGEKDMICRLYGPAGLLEWSGLLSQGENSWKHVLLGDNAVWLSGVPTKDHVDGERVSFYGLLAVRGTQRRHVRDDVYETYYRVEAVHIDYTRVDVALGAAAMADDENPEMHERLNELRKLAGLTLSKTDATKESETKAQQQPAQRIEKIASGFWLSRSTNKDDESVVLSIAQPSEPGGDYGNRFDQNFARASIGRKLERGEKVFVHDFTVEFFPPDSEQGTSSGMDSKSVTRGLWLIRDMRGELKLGYDREKLSAKAKRRGEPIRRWTSIDDSFFTQVVGRNLKPGERAFLHDPKVDNGS